MELDKMLEEALKNVLPQVQGESVTKADVAAMLDGVKTELTTQFSEMVQKAFPIDREGVGRKEIVKSDEEAFEEAPAEYLVKKGEAVTSQEKQVAVAIFKKVMGEGLI